jgi:hypothetical protein
MVDSSNAIDSLPVFDRLEVGPVKVFSMPNGSPGLPTGTVMRFFPAAALVEDLETMTLAEIYQRK